ncbi:hypothetical protein BaRGS_00025196, partial [Batillaria attramentaria]
CKVHRSYEHRTDTEKLQIYEDYTQRLHLVNGNYQQLSHRDRNPWVAGYTEQQMRRPKGGSEAISTGRAVHRLLTVQPPRQRLLTVQPPRQRLLTVQPPRQRLLTVQPPRQRLLTVQPPRQRLLTVQPPRQRLLTVQPPRQRLLTVQPPRQRLLTVQPPRLMPLHAASRALHQISYYITASQSAGVAAAGTGSSQSVATGCTCRYITVYYCLLCTADNRSVSQKKKLDASVYSGKRWLPGLNLYRQTEPKGQYMYHFGTLLHSLAVFARRLSAALSLQCVCACVFLQSCSLCSERSSCSWSDSGRFPVLARSILPNRSAPSLRPNWVPVA